MSQQIHVPKPCHEDWDKMTPEANGRHCLQCCQTVVDFTGWEADAIAAYLKQAGSKVCGRFTASQLHQPEPQQAEELAQHIIRATMPLYRKLAAMIILFFGLSATAADAQQVKQARPKTEQHILMGDTVKAPSVEPVVGTVAYVRDTPKIDYPIMGKIAPPKDRPKPKPQPKHKPAPATKKPVPPAKEPIIQGDVQMVAPPDHKKP